MALLMLSLVGAACGLLFAAVSTYDFVAHLDRQVHGLHCSLLPGLGTPDASGTSGCHVTLMSPYSSLLRGSLWGGIPISLPAMAVFAFLLFWGINLWISERSRDARATGFYALAAALPLLASGVMAVISLSALSALCKLCVGIYLSSIACFAGAFGLWWRARREPYHGRSISLGGLAVAFVFGCLFVGSSVVSYAASAPNFERYLGSCGKLEAKADTRRALLSLGGPAGGPRIIEVLDPLCPACRGFEERFEKLALVDRAQRQVLVFPLDNACNWMVDQALHPGSCAISEALLCAGDQAKEVLAWAFSEQQAIMAAETANKGAARKLVSERFPSLAGCVGSSKAKARVNRSLLWAVDHKLPVLTPQVYVNGVRLCDADTDLGLDYMLSGLVERGAQEAR